MPRYRAIPAKVTDLRQAPGNEPEEAAVESVVEELQVVEEAPEAAPAEEKKPSKKKAAK